MRITVGRMVSEGKVEFKIRSNSEVEEIEISSVIDKVKEEFKKNTIKL
jgi:prolyl-tRNA synthetase